MSILVAYATCNGSTAEIAARIGERLELAGVEHEVVPVEGVVSVEGFDGVVLGSAVHSQSWLPDATRFVEQFGSAIGDRPVWLFSVSSVGETSSVFGSRMAAAMRRMRPEPRGVEAARAHLQVGDHRNFAGVVEPEMWGRAGDVFIRLLRGRYGDRRDWADITSWADLIAGSLASAEAR